MALGIGLVILANPALAAANGDLNAFGWFLVGVGSALLLASVIWTVVRANNRPKLVIERGSDDEVMYVLSEREPRKYAQLRDLCVGDVYTTRLRVRETNDERAVSVHVRAKLKGTRAPAGLQWLDDTNEHTIQGGGRSYVRVCEVFEYTDGRDTKVLSHHPDIERGKSTKVDLEILVNGRPQKRTYRFVVDWRDNDARFPEVTPLP